MCSDIPENTLVTEDNAMHFKKSDITDLAEKLQEMCNNSELVNEFKNKSAEYILGKYNWNDVADATHNLYKKVTKK